MPALLQQRHFVDLKPFEMESATTCIFQLFHAAFLGPRDNTAPSVLHRSCDAVHVGKHLRPYECGSRLRVTIKVRGRETCPLTCPSRTWIHVDGFHKQDTAHVVAVSAMFSSCVPIRNSTRARSGSRHLQVACNDRNDCRCCWKSLCLEQND